MASVRALSPSRARSAASIVLLTDVPAVANHKVIALSDAFLVAPSPRVKQALDRLSTAIR